MKKYILLLLFIQITFCGYSDSRYYFLETLLEIESMLSGESTLDYKKAVFITENTYFEGKLKENIFYDNIRNYASICNLIIQSGNIIYPESDKEEANAQCAVFLFMTDSIPIQTGSNIVFHTPFEYNFEDFAGKIEYGS